MLSAGDLLHLTGLELKLINRPDSLGSVECGNDGLLFVIKFVAVECSRSFFHVSMRFQNSTIVI